MRVYKMLQTKGLSVSFLLRKQYGTSFIEQTKENIEIKGGITERNCTGNGQRNSRLLWKLPTRSYQSIPTKNFRLDPVSFELELELV